MDFIALVDAYSGTPLEGDTVYRSSGGRLEGKMYMNQGCELTFEKSFKVEKMPPIMNPDDGGVAYHLMFGNAPLLM